MQSLDGDLIHFISNRVIPLPSQAVDTGPDQEVRSDLLRRAEQFVDIALAIADMDASSWIFPRCSKKTLRLATRKRSRYQALCGHFFAVPKSDVSAAAVILPAMLIGSSSRAAVAVADGSAKERRGNLVGRR